MIEESLLKSGILGKDGFTWWIGRVAHPSYWKDTNSALSITGEMSQRCKVRIIGYHPWDNTLEEKDLPWAHIMMDPITGSGQGGRGVTNSLVGGETCLGFFLDGEDGQQPVIIGLLNRNEAVENSIKESEIFAEKSSNFKVFTGHSGNRIPPTKRTSVTTNPVSKGNTGSINSNSSSKKESGVYIKDGKASAAAAKFESITTTTWKNPSKCGDDLIGRLTQVLTDFIAFVNTLESALGTFVSPVLNEVVNIGQSIKSVASQLGGIVKQIINNMRDGIIKCLISLFKKFLALQKKINPADFALSPAAQKATKTLLEQIFCIFEKVIDEIIDFIFRMLENLIGKVVNGPACAAEQFVSGLLAKIMELIENALEPVISGVNWLTGGLGNITKVLSDTSNLATQIYTFIGCDGIKCDTPSEWISSTNAALKKAGDDWQKQVNQVNVFKDISKDLSEISDAIGSGNYEGQSYKGSSITGILNSVDTLTGGQSAQAFNRGLGSIESAIATASIFGGENSVFDACNRKTSNPQSQDDLIRMPIGYKYAVCIPPKVEVFGNGFGAKLNIVVGNDGRIFSIEVINGGNGYDEFTAISIIDNSGYGSGAQAKAIIKEGRIDKVVILSPGSGYCGGSSLSLDGGINSGIGTNVVGVVTTVYVQSPGFGYTSGDTIGIGNTTATINITPNGSIVSINIPSNFRNEFTSSPILTINTETGVGAELIPIMAYSAQFTSDIEERPIVGITSVIDCI